MKAGVFIKGDIEIRRLKSGRWVLEAEWQQYVEINNILRVPYMLENEPFEKLLVPYRPLPKHNHYPPWLRFGFAIPDHVDEFRRAALKHKLGDPEELNSAGSSSLLRSLITSHINDRCGLQTGPGQGVICQYIDSKHGDLVLGIATNYKTRVPGNKLEDVLRWIRELLSLPDLAVLRTWYL